MLTSRSLSRPFAVIITVCESSADRGVRPSAVAHAPGRKRATLRNLLTRLLSEAQHRPAVQPHAAAFQTGANLSCFGPASHHKTKFNINKVSCALCICARILPAANSLQKRRNEFTSCLSNLSIREKPFKFAIKSVAAGVMRGRRAAAPCGKALNAEATIRFISDSLTLRISGSGC